MKQYVEKSSFIIEFTERDFSDASKDTSLQLSRLRKNGYRVWLDDFGSGYSSFKTFDNIQFDLIKFDVDFIKKLNVRSSSNRLILKRLIDLARELEINTLAEGIETEAQNDFVREIGFDLAQGYLYNEPEPLSLLLRHLFGGDHKKPCETEEERNELDRRLMERNEL